MVKENTKLGKNIIQGLKEAIAYKKGGLTEGDGVKIYNNADGKNDKDKP